jgi:thiamine biosynthesis lipoprotein
MNGQFRRLRPIMGTFVEIGVCGEQNITALKAVEAAFYSIEKIQSLMSFQDSKSDLSRLNLNPGVEILVHPLTTKVLRLARRMTHLSDSYFNCTVGGQMVRQGDLPDHGGPKPLRIGHAGDIVIQENRVTLLRPIRVTLDGIAKGFAVDLAIRVLKKQGILSGWVNAGGDIRVFGNFVLPLHRRELSGEILSLGGLQNAAIATSRLDARFDKCFPARLVSSKERSVIANAGIFTVLSHTAWRADALTKVAALAPQSLRSKYVDRLGGRLVETALA